jgi:hypothetical protein
VLDTGALKPLRDLRDVIFAWGHQRIELFPFEMTAVAVGASGIGRGLDRFLYGPQTSGVLFERNVGLDQGQLLISIDGSALGADPLTGLFGAQGAPVRAATRGTLAHKSTQAGRCARDRQCRGQHHKKDKDRSPRHVQGNLS